MRINSMFVVFDPGSIAGILGNVAITAVSYVAIASLLINLGKYIIIGVSWLLDNLLLNFIATMYEYFERILMGTIFTDSIVDEMMSRVYLIIGVIFVFRLGMLIVHYMINPAEVLEEKGGVNSLVKRAIIGLALIIFIPSLFDIANQLQAAILKDQVIERIILNDKQLDEIEEMQKEYGTGRIIGMLVFQGFWNIDKNQTTDGNLIRAYEEAEEKMDPSVIEDYGYKITDTVGDRFIINYFPILSTIVLGYVLYLVIKYCLDLVVRMFKLLILQIISPITIIEYIINGDRNEVFAKWKTSVIANYAMVFIRVFSLWFVVFIAYLLKNGVDGESLLNTQDYLLKAIIVLGLLAFMMEFPKMISDLFGLDLEQDSAVKGVLGKVAGAGKMLGGAVAMAGGAALGGIAGAAGSNISAYKETKQAKKDGNLTDERKKQIKANANKTSRSAALGAAKGLGMATLSTTPITASLGNSASQGFGSSYGAYAQSSKGIKESEKEAATQAYRQHQMATSDQQLEEMINQNIKLGINENIDSVKVQSKGKALGDLYNSDNTIMGQLQQGNQTAEATRQTTAKINEELQGVAGSVKTTELNTKAAVDQLGELKDTAEATKETMVTMNNDVKVIAGKTSEIADNTMYSGIESLENLKDYDQSVT